MATSSVSCLLGRATRSGWAATGDVLACGTDDRVDLAWTAHESVGGGRAGRRPPGAGSPAAPRLWRWRPECRGWSPTQNDLDVVGGPDNPELVMHGMQQGQATVQRPRVGGQLKASSVSRRPICGLAGGLWGQGTLARRSRAGRQSGIHPLSRAASRPDPVRRDRNHQFVAQPPQHRGMTRPPAPGWWFRRVRVPAGDLPAACAAWGNTVAHRAGVTRVGPGPERVSRSGRPGSHDRKLWAKMSWGCPPRGAEGNVENFRASPGPYTPLRVSLPRPG